MRDSRREHESTTSAGILLRAAFRQLSVTGLRRTPPIWREARMFPELAALRRDPISSGVGLPSGHGRPVFLIPGYMAGDASLAPMARALRSVDFRTETSGFRINVGCANEMYGPLEARLAAHVARCDGQKAFVVGQSRGGSIGRWLAVKRPDLVAGLVTLGSPLVDPFAVNVLVLMNLGVIGTLGSLGVPGVLTTKCIRPDRCCEPVWREGRGKLAEGMPFLSIYSRSDGIVDWRACLDPAARHLEVDSSHCGMAFNVDVLRAIGNELSAAGNQPAARPA